MDYTRSEAKAAALVCQPALVTGVAQACKGGP